MSKSLAGALVPLASGKGSESTGSSALSGGLIPLAGRRNSSAAVAGGSTATFGRLIDSDGSDWDNDDEKNEGKAVTDSAFIEDNKSKRVSRRGRDTGRKKKQGSNSRRETEADSSRSSKSRKEKTKRGDGENRRQKALMPDPVTDDDGDDDYLFMGATAGAKGGRKSGTGMAEATALLLEGSDDSFSFATTSRTRKSKPLTIDESLPRGTGLSGDISSTGSTSSMRTSETKTMNARTEDERGLYASTAFRHDDSRSTTSHPGGVGHESGKPLNAFTGTSGKETSAFGRLSSGLAGPSTTIHNSDEADALLRPTDPDALAGVATAASTTTPEIIPSQSGADARHDESRQSRFTALSSSTVNVKDTRTIGWGQSTEAASKRRSPSPPSGARRARSESPQRSPRRSLVSHGVTTSLSSDSAPAIGETAEQSKHERDNSVTEGVTDGTYASSRRSEAASGNSGTIAEQTVGIGSVTEHSEHTSPSISSRGAVSATALTRGTMPRRSALTAPNKPRRREGKVRGVSFDDDLGDLDALDVLPGSDDDAPTPSSAAAASRFSSSIDNVEKIPPTDIPSPSADDNTLSVVSTGKTFDRRTIAGEKRLDADGDAGQRPTSTRELATNLSFSTTSRSAQRSMPITAGLSPAAARLMAEDSSSGEDQSLTVSKNADLHSRLGLGTAAVTAKPADDVVRTPAVVPYASNDDAKLDLVLGFTPSAMDAGRRKRRAIPAGGRRRPRLGDSLKNEENRPEVPTPTAQGPVLTPTTVANAAAVTGRKEGALHTEVASVAERTHDISPGPGHSRSLPLESTVHSSPYNGLAVDKDVPATSMMPAGGVANSLPAVTLGRPTGTVEKKSSPNVTGGGDGGGAASATGGEKTQADPSPYTSRPRKYTTGEAGTVDASVLSSLERQLILLTNEREATAARFLREEQRLELEATASKVAGADAEARARDVDSALAAARVRIRQLEAEAVGHKATVAALESKSASDLGAEQASSIRKMGDAETRHHADLRTALERHEEALSELKRLHREELEDVRRRSADSQTLETLAGQVQASAGALKLLQADMVERRGAAEVSREGQMDARERLIQELEGSAKRAQQTAEDEVQRLQGTLMAMDQVMRGLRGQNAGERERLRHEHLRLDALQASMVAEVEAMRKGIDMEQKRLAERSVALDRQKKEADLAARADIDRLAEERLKLKMERKTFADCLVSASQAAEETAKRHAEEEQRLNLARQSLEKEAMHLEARLTTARADLRKAEDVRVALDGAREQDELERRRLKRMAAELERAFEDVRIRGSQIEERWLETENARVQAIESSREVRKANESLRLRSTQVEEAARRQDEERTLIAQARAQSATELSTSRRLKSELARAVTAHEKQRWRSNQPTLLSSDVHANAMSTAEVSMPCNRISHPPASHQGWRASAEFGNAIVVKPNENAKECNTHQPSRHPGPPGTVAIPNTGLAAAEATLQAAASAPPFAGLDVGKELTRLAQRATDIRQCTREQRAFLSNARVTTALCPTSLASPATPEYLSFTGDHRTMHTSMHGRSGGDGSAAAPLFLSSRVDSVIRGSGSSAGQWMQDIGWQVGQTGGGSGDILQAIGGTGCGLSNTMMEEMDDIERACSKRALVLDEDAPFLESLGSLEDPGVVV